MQLQTVSNNITVTASRTGFQTITASNPSNFNNNGSIIGTFDYASATIESPADLSYFILQSGATGVDTSITREISASERALTGIASKTLYVYGKLVTGQGTPITKAFWDPSANSGAGAEFNQRVDTASDLEMQLNVTESELDQVTDAAATEFFANVAICEIEVDSSGIILSVRDTRPLFFEAQDDRPWDRANAYASMTLPSTVTNVSVNVMIPANVFPPTGTPPTSPARTVTGSTGGPFVLDETVSFWPISGSPSEATTSAQIQSLSGTTTDFNKLDLSAVPSRQRIAIGETSGTIRIVDEVRSNFFRDDKALGDFRNGLSALATEINNMKGTENWYDDPPASAKDLLRFINSTIIGLDPDARYSWTAAGSADGTLSIRKEPLANNVTITLSSNGLDANDTIIFTNSTSANSVTLTAVTSSPAANQFLIGVDTEATTSHLASAINAVTDLSATFAQSGSDFIITVGSNDNTFTTVTTTADGTDGLVIAGSPFDYSTVGNLANIKVYGVDADFFFPESSLVIGTNEVLFITLPDLDSDSLSNQTYDQTQFRYSVSGPSDATNWNSTNRDIFVNSTDRFKTVPVDEFIGNERNYWVAYRDESETIFVRDIGELGTGEAANIGHGISNATLSYIGAPNENTSTPNYATVNSIIAFPPAGTEGAFEAADSGSDFNNTMVAQSENLTSAINDLNTHLVSIRDTQYQNLGLKLINGGYWGWSLDSGTGVGTLTTQESAQIQIPGLADNRNTLLSNTTTPFSHTLEQTGDVLYVDINRQDNRTNKTVASQLTVISANVNAARTGFILFEPTRDRIVFARRVDEFVFIGVNGTIRLADDQAAPLDSALQFIGVNGSGQLPRQLNTAPVTGQVLSVGTSTVTFPTGGNITTGTTDDTSVTLDLSIGGGVLFWEGARFDLSLGIVQDSNGDTPFRSRSGGNTTFSFDNLPGLSTPGNREIYYAISLDDAGAITSSTGADLLPAATVLLNLNKRLGEPNITKSTDIGFTNTTGTNERAIPPEFGGALPIALIRVTTDSSGAYEPITMDRVTVLGASGSGGGGGTGNAVQDINNYLNRLNGSTFGYFSALVPAVSTDDFVDSNSTAGIANAGISLTAGLSVLTTNLIDQEFIEDALIPERMEIEAIWGQTVEAPIATQIDPNARWFISLNANDVTTGGTLGTNQFTPLTFASTKNVVGVITSAGVLVGTNLTNAPLTQIDTFFVENHGFSTGHKVSLTTAGGLTLTDATDIYVHSINADSFQLYSTVANADDGGTTGLIEITATTLGSPVFTRGEGIIPRIGHTNTVRGVFDQRDLVTTVGAINRRRGGAYSTTSNPTVRLFVTGDTDSGTGAPEIIMTSLALFYADELGIEGVNPNGLDDVNNILRSSHLVNTVTATAGYGAPGRGVVLLDTAGANKELSISSGDKLRIDGTELSTGHIVESGIGTDLAERTNLQFRQGLAASDDSANDRTIVDNADNNRAHLQSAEQVGVRNGSCVIANQVSHTWTCPADVNRIYIEIVGSGSSGETNSAQGGGGNGHGGGAGSYYQHWHDVVPSSSYTIAVGNAAGQRTGACGGQQFAGAATFISGNIDGSAGVTITAGGGTINTNAPGDVTLSGFTNFFTPRTEGDDIAFSDNPHQGQIVADWNRNEWRTSGVGTGGGGGGSNFRAQGGAASTQGGAGGAGYIDGAGGSTDGSGNSGGPGGIRISWYSNVSTSTTNPIT